MKKNHLIPLLGSNHLKYGVIATALCALSLFIGLSAYLVTSTEEPYESSFRTATGSEFGLTISGNEYTNDVVYPGQELNLSPTVTSTTSMYVFAEVDLGGLEVENISWYPVTGEDGLYYYGSSDNSIAALNGESTIFDVATVPTSAGTDTEFSPSIVAYGIQTEGISGTPDQIWSMIESGMEGNEP